MRNLNNSDLFKVMRIMRKANIKSELAEMQLPDSVNEEQYGAMMILQVIESAPQAEQEIFQFLADIANVEVKEIEEDEFDLLPKIIEHLQKQDKLIAFLKQAFKSLN